MKIEINIDYESKKCKFEREKETFFQLKIKQSESIQNKWWRCFILKKRIIIDIVKMFYNLFFFFFFLSKYEKKKKNKIKSDFVKEY